MRKCDSCAVSCENETLYAYEGRYYCADCLISKLSDAGNFMVKVNPYGDYIEIQKKLIQSINSVAL